MTRKIPTPEEAHEPYARLLERNIELNYTIARLRGEASTLRAVASAAGGESEVRSARVASLAEGRDFTPPVPVNEKLTTTLRDLRDAEDALVVVTDKMRIERGVASQKVSALFSQEHKALSRRFWVAIGEACSASIEISQIHTNLARAGIEPLGLGDPAVQIFDEHIDRRSQVAARLRRAVGAGLAPETAVPQAFR